MHSAMRLLSSPAVPGGRGSANQSQAAPSQRQQAASTGKMRRQATEDGARMRAAAIPFCGGRTWQAVARVRLLA